VPQIEAQVKASRREVGQTLHPTGRPASESEWHTEDALSKSPQPPASEPSWMEESLNSLEDRLAADIRAIDGNHDKGAAELAEQLIASGWHPAQAGEREEVERLREQVNYWIENGCTPPPTVDELKNYACSECRCRGVKLWREPHGGDVLKCATCLSPENPVGEDGRQASEYGPMTDQVANWLPAVPSQGSFYGYSSVPPQAVGWWRGLPTYSEAAARLAALEASHAALQAELEAVRLRLLSAAGDDLCRLSQEEIKELSSGRVQIPPKEEFLASCERFHEQIASGPGVLNNCLTLAQLIAENTALQAKLDAVTGLEKKWRAWSRGIGKSPVAAQWAYTRCADELESALAE
jgi:hypothetical protein